MRKATTKTAPKTQKKETPLEFNEQGLRNGIEYHFSENGQVDWRKMVGREHLALNREKFLRKDKPVDVESITKEERDELFEKAKDDDLIIKLSGCKELLWLRGFSKVEEKVISASPDFAAVQCVIEWVPNFETGNESVSFSGVADAHAANVAGFSSNYLLAVASNRAFCRAVRNFLRIHVVSQDELSSEKTEEISTAVSAGPASVLEEKMKKKGISLEDLKKRLEEEEYEFIGIDTWVSTKDINASLFPIIFGILSKL